MTYIVTNGTRGAGALRYEVPWDLEATHDRIWEAIEGEHWVEVPSLDEGTKPCYVNPDNIVSIYEAAE